MSGNKINSLKRRMTTAAASTNIKKLKRASSSNETITSVEIDKLNDVKPKVKHIIPNYKFMVDEDVFFLDSLKTIYISIGYDSAKSFQPNAEIRSIGRRSSVQLNYDDWLAFISVADLINNFFNNNQNFSTTFGSNISVKSTVRYGENQIIVCTKFTSKSPVYFNASSWNNFLLKKDYIQSVMYSKWLNCISVKSYFDQYLLMCKTLNVNYLTFNNYFEPKDKNEHLPYQKLFSDFSCINDKLIIANTM